MPNQILSIDLDILFSNSLGLCTTFSERMPREVFWKRVYQDFKPEFFNCNQDYYNKLTKILNLYANRVDKIYVGQDHSSIIEALDLEKSNFNNYSFNIHNIDFHHDISYGQTDEDEVVESFICNCGSWVGLLNHCGYINSYTWYYGFGSNFREKALFSEENPLTPRRVDRISFEYSGFPMDLDIKMLYITFSPLWIPYGQESVILKLLNSLPSDKIVFLKDPYFNNQERKDFLNHSYNKERFNFDGSFKLD